MAELTKYVDIYIVYLFVCVNTLISVVITALDTKFGMKVPIFVEQVNLILNFSWHAYCLSK